MSALVIGMLWSGPPAAAGARVYATLALSPVPSSIQTGQLVTFTGTVSPALGGERVVLQRLARNHFRHIGGGFPTSPDGSFSITHVFGVPSHSSSTLLRICLRRNALDFRSCSAPFAVTIVRSTPPNLTARERHLRRLKERRQHKEEVRKLREEARLKRIQAREERRSKRIQARAERLKRKEAARKLREEARLKRIQAREEERKRKQEEARKRREEKHHS